MLLSTLQKLESGVSDPKRARAEIILKLAKALETTVADLIE